MRRSAKVFVCGAAALLLSLAAARADRTGEVAGHAFGNPACESVPGVAPNPACRGSATGGAAPDWSFTPGALCRKGQPGFVEFRYGEHIPICKPTITPDMKRRIAEHYGVPEKDWGKYEFAFLIPPSLGGASSIDNIWLRPKGKPDDFEKTLVDLMRAGKITQAEAINRIRARFVVAGDIDGTYRSTQTKVLDAHVTIGPEAYTFPAEFEIVARNGAISGRLTGSYRCGSAIKLKMACGDYHATFAGTADADGAVTAAITGSFATRNIFTDNPMSQAFGGTLSGRLKAATGTGEFTVWIVAANGHHIFPVRFSWTAARTD